MARNYSSVVEPKALTSNITDAAATQITLNNVTGLPSAPYVLVINPDTAKEEVVLVTVDQTGVTSPTLKVQRAIEASGGVGVARNDHTIGDVVKHMIVGSDLQIVHDHFSNESTTAGTAHGATGGVVGRTNSQTLTNKTINLTDNTLTGTKAQFNAALSDADFVTIAGTETLTSKTLTSPVITGGTINGGVALTVDSTELNTLDGITSSAAELNILDGATLTTTELNYVDGVTSAIQTQLTTNTPVGVVNMWVTNTAPTGWLICDGSTKSTTTNPEYANLYGVIGTTYGGTGATSFRLPDLRGRAPIGAGTGNQYDGSKADIGDLTARTLGGYVSNDETVVLTEAQLASHNHTQNSHNHTQDAHTHTFSYSTAGGGSANAITVGTVVSAGGELSALAATNQPTTATNNPTGSNTAHNNTQPSTVINFIIKF